MPKTYVTTKVIIDSDVPSPPLPAIAVAAAVLLTLLQVSSLLMLLWASSLLWARCSDRRRRCRCRKGCRATESLSLSSFVLWSSSFAWLRPSLSWPLLQPWSGRRQVAVVVVSGRVRVVRAEQVMWRLSAASAKSYIRGIEPGNPQPHGFEKFNITNTPW